MIGGIISGGASLLGGLSGIGATKRQQKRQHEYNMQMTKYQNDLSVDWWNMKNEYNSPENQMKRLKEAGINPATAYGSVSGASQASEIGTPETPRYQRADYGKNIDAMFSSVGQYLNTERQQAEVNNLKMQNNILKVDYDNKLVDLALRGMRRDTYMDEYNRGVKKFWQDYEFNNDKIHKQRIDIDVANDRYQAGAHMTDFRKAMAELTKLNYENTIRSQGMNPNDPTWMKWLYNIGKNVTKGSKLSTLFNYLK